jgi:hypothetical protein
MHFAQKDGGKSAREEELAKKVDVMDGMLFLSSWMRDVLICVHNRCVDGS